MMEKDLQLKILYDALDKIKSKNNEDPLKILTQLLATSNQTLSADLEELVVLPIKSQ